MPPEPLAVAPVKISPGAQAAKLVKKIVPVYPAIPKRIRLQGRVILHAIIGRDGKIRDLQAIEGHQLLRQAALDAVQQWEYSPTMLGDQPVEVDTVIEVNFVLN